MNDLLIIVDEKEIEEKDSPERGCQKCRLYDSGQKISSARGSVTPFRRCTSVNTGDTEASQSPRASGPSGAHRGLRFRVCWWVEQPRPSGCHPALHDRDPQFLLKTTADGEDHVL